MIHSLCPFTSSDGTNYVLFWQDLVPKSYNLGNRVIIDYQASGNVLGAPITASPTPSDGATGRWSYALGRSGYLYATNGFDKKFFDGSKWRELGLPVLLAADVEAVAITTGSAGMNEEQIAGITLAMTGSTPPYMLPASSGATPELRCVEMKYFPLVHAWNGAFGYYHAGDPANVGGVTLPPATSTVNGDSLLFNPRNSYLQPMEMKLYDSAGNPNATTPYVTVPFWVPPGLATQLWTMTVCFTLSVPAAATYHFIINHLDGMFFCIGPSGGNQPNLQKGFLVNGFGHTESPLNGYPPIAGNNNSGYNVEDCDIYFPAAGSYPFEMDYANWKAGQHLTVYIDNLEVKNVAPFPVSGGSTPDAVGRTVYCVLFDETADVSKNPRNALSPPSLLGTVIFGSGMNLLVSGLPDFTGSTTPPAFPTLFLDKLIALSGDGSTTVHFVAQRNVIITGITGPVGASTVTAPGVAVSAGDIVGIAGTGDIQLDGYLFLVQTAPSTDTFTIISIPGTSSGVYHTGTVSVLYKAGYAATVMPPIPNTTFFSGYTVDISGEIGIAGSTVGGAQPGYLFFASIYNTVTGHIGNRIQLDGRVTPPGRSVVTISGLPPLPDPEWAYLIGRSGDGGEVPYAIMHADGTWFTTPGPTVSISASQIDGAAELPINNDEPPAFDLLWREGDRICGVKLDAALPGANAGTQPKSLRATVYRSGSEIDAMTGDFMGDPGQAWSPSKIETFPTAEAIVGGFGYDGSSWVFTESDFGELSELTGETMWNGPWNIGVAGPHAFTRGWKNLPFWVSHDKQLCVMTPSTNFSSQSLTEAVPISSEYEAALLSKIGDAYLRETELLSYRDLVRQIEILRIKCRDANGNPFTVIHDFNLRDQRSPFGQGYMETFAGSLATNYTHEVVRDANGHMRVWAGAGNQLYQLYTGGNDGGTEFTADGLTLQYVGAQRTTVQYIDFYGDEKLEWYVASNLDSAADPLQMYDLSEYVQRVQGEEHNAHYQISLERPEMIHAYIWFRLQSHSIDGTTDLNDPPHMPIETYGRLLMASPLIGTSSGR